MFYSGSVCFYINDVLILAIKTIKLIISLEVHELNKFCFTHVAMYQTEIAPDIEKVNRTIKSNCQELSSEVDKSKNSGQSGHKAGNQCNIVTPPTHDHTLKHPSEVLIDLKVRFTIY